MKNYRKPAQRPCLAWQPFQNTATVLLGFTCSGSVSVQGSGRGTPYTPPLDSYINDEYVEDLVLSSVLHDIGKVGVSDAILLKPERLTKEEFQSVKAHTLLGGDALESVEKRMDGRSFFTLGKQIAYSHHERWDGKGYPSGLSVDAIPLSARIVAVADTYEAITTDRVYRAALPHDEAMRRILKGRGTQFDPGVVDALVASQSSVMLLTDAQEN